MQPPAGASRFFISIIALILGGLTSLAFLFYFQYTRNNTNQGWVEHTQEVLYRAETILVTVIDNETGSRGYLLTGDRRFLEPLLYSKEAIHDQIIDLKALTKDNSHQQARLDSLLAYSNRRFLFSDSTIEVRNDHSLQSAIQLVASGNGKYLTDQIRNIIHQIEQEETTLLRKRRAETAVMVSRLRTAVLILFPVLAVIITSLFWKEKVIESRLIKLSSELLKNKKRMSYLATIADNIPDPVISTYLDGYDNPVITQWNKPAENMFGWTIEEAVGQPFGKIVHAEYVGIENKDLLEILKQTGTSWQGEAVYFTKTGNPVDLLITASSLKDEDGCMNGYLILAKDITERKKTERELELLVWQLNQSNDSIYVLDANYNIISWNLGAEKLYGYSKEEAMYKNSNDLLKTAITKDELNAILLETSQNEYWEGEIQREKKTGEVIFVHASLTRLKERDGRISGYVTVSFDITKAREAEIRIKEFEHFFNNSNDLSGIANTDGYFEVINPNFKKILGYDKEFTENAFINFVHPDDIPATMQEYEKLKAGEPVIHFINRYRKINGTYLWFEWNATPNPVTGKLYCIARDITARKKAEDSLMSLNAELENRILERTEKLTASETRFRSLIENIDEGIVLSDKDFHTTYRSPSSEKITGIIPMGDTRYRTHPEDVERISEIRKLVVKNPGVPIVFQGRFMNSQDQYAWIEGTFNNLLNLKGVNAIVTNYRDITQRKKAEETIAHTLNEKKNILESIGDAFFAVDKNWVVTYWNHIAERDLQMPKEQIVGKNLWEIFADGTHSESFKKYNEVMVSNKVVLFQDYFTPLSKWYEISAYPSESGISVYLKDISERKAIDKKLENINKELEERVDRRTLELKKSNEELESFSYSVSHDLRSPLRAINSYAQILEEDFGPSLDPEAGRMIQTINRNAKKMGQLVDDLLDFSRIGRKDLVYSMLPMDRIVKETCLELQKENPAKPIDFKFGEILSAAADMVSLKQVWVNLISNAIKYSGLNEKIVVEIHSVCTRDEIIYSVRDYGVGFDMQYVKKLFKTFQRLHSDQEFEGTGIGLAIVKRIIDKHGGRVWAESKLTEGASFYFTLKKV